MGQANQIDEMQEAFVKVLSEIQGYLVDKNYDECWEYIKTVKKEISEDIIKESPVAKPNDSL